MMQKSLIKATLSITLFSITLYGAQSSRTIPYISPTMTPTNSPQCCFIKPIIEKPGEFRKVFSQENLDTLRPDQDTKTIEELCKKETYLTLAAYDNDDAIVAACLSFLAGDEVWLKSFAVNRNASCAALRAAVRTITKQLKHTNPGHRIVCNVHTSKDPLNVTILNTMALFGWKTTHCFHKLEKSINDIVKHPLQASLAFTTTKEKNASITRFHANNILTDPKTLPFFDCSSDEVTTYLNHPSCTTIVAYLLKQNGPIPAGALIFTMPKPSHGKVEFIGVLPPARRTRVATTLLALAQQIMHEDHNATKIEINVLENNYEALKCYKAAGFNLISTMAKLRASTTVSPQPETIVPIQLPPAVTTNT